ncbi:RHS repeat-associated core domain-containing protein [Chengkuizengella sp. SCS-71B]|uniref:RHS repeat-associated core domain-containing protein n=1 Tax=Chengkuizengella sp. SCS-71B TaxID=3115290 RepID=UPI0032C22D24
MIAEEVPLTNIDGVITDQYAYSPYGELIYSEGTTNHPFLYNGRYGVMTDENGLYYMRARYYNPEIKRFINRDVVQGSISSSSLSLNKYAYVNGNPISYIDPFGLSRDSDDVGFFSMAGNTIVGVGEGIWSTAEGLWDSASHPIETGKNIGYAVMHPIQTGKAVYHSGEQAYYAFMEADGNQRANMIGSLIGENVFPVGKAKQISNVGEISNKAQITKGTGAQLALPAPQGSNPWVDGGEIVSMVAPKDFKINMAMAPNQTRPGGWGTLDDILDVNYVRNNLAVTPEFKPEVSKVQQYLVPEGTRIQVGEVGPQIYNDERYPGGGNQVQILNYSDRANLIPIGEPKIIK